MTPVTVIGLDLGTSGVKALLVDERQRVLAEAETPLGIQNPRPGWSEQEPEDWWRAALAALGALKREAPQKTYAATRAIGLCGQMHGAVLIDGQDRPLRPAMLWNDARAVAECDALNRAVPDLARRAGVAAMPGFTAPKLLWVKRHEPAVFARIASVLLPKDYLRLKLTAERVTDVSDAAGTLWLDQVRRAWLEACVAASGLEPEQLPRLVEAPEPAGAVRPALARELGFSGPVVVAGGAGDAPAGALGLGAINRGDAVISLGTACQYFVTTEAYRFAPRGLLHSFAHGLPGRWYRMAAHLNGASALSWIARALGEPDIGALLRQVEAHGARPSRVLFLPYLAGERTPHDDPQARGVFFGLDPATSAEDLVRAVLEGVAFSLAGGQAALIAAGTAIGSLAATGGGARSRLWMTILASALDRPIVLHEGRARGPAFGAARLARMALDGISPAQACPAPAIAATIEPDPRLAAHYGELRPRFEALYAALRPVFAGHAPR